MLSNNTVIAQNEISIDTAAFFSLNNTLRIREQADIRLSDRSYLPKANDPRSDWVASVTVPAFLALAQTGIEVQDFCTIGTGAGLDALAAIEILNARNIIITDLHDDVVSLARENIIQNTKQNHRVTVFAGIGDLLSPLRQHKYRIRCQPHHVQCPELALAERFFFRLP